MMKTVISKLFLAALFYTGSLTAGYCQLYEWRGPDRSGIYNESGLLKKWPDSGPALLWEAENMGDGYSSPVVAGETVYVTGRKDSSDVLTALGPDGKIKWTTVYGKAWIANHTGSRCTPTYYYGNVFLISGSGDIVCDGKVKSVNDSVKIKQASKLALEYFRAAGSQASLANKLDEAIVMLNKAAKYGDDKDLFYYFADVYNKQNNYDSGTEFARKGLALETGSPEAKAKFYFQLALAQTGKGQTADACASFKNAMYGPFAEPSKAQRTNLKCQ